MTKTVTEERVVCDYCEKAGAWYRCKHCGKEFCSDCAKEKGVNYKFGVYVQGYADGFYCNACDEILARTKADHLHNAYVQIQALSAESEAFYGEWNKRRKEVEAFIESNYKDQA